MPRQSATGSDFKLTHYPLADYLEHYGISEDELQLFVSDPEAAAAFARCCGNRELDDRLVLKPGRDRGVWT